ncbi:hypothetical protein KCP69_20855 [Salmonella enterica subsp. enterica]|nr:hypothetical protein KCP69_20855 [Salmonella enterica subsp. enterica]
MGCCFTMFLLAYTRTFSSARPQRQIRTTAPNNRRKTPSSVRKRHSGWLSRIPWSAAAGHHRAGRHHKWEHSDKFRRREILPQAVPRQL